MNKETDPDVRIGRQPPPTDEDRALLDEIVKGGLGEQATAVFMGAMSRGARGDGAHYGHAVIIIDPNFVELRGDPTDYYAVLEAVSTQITNAIEVAGNVTIDLSGGWVEDLANITDNPPD